MTTPGLQGRKYDLGQAYQQVFGYVRPPYPIEAIRNGVTLLNPVGLVRGKVKALRGAFRLGSSLGPDYSFPTELAGFQLPNEPTIRITGGKKIIETKLTRLDAQGQLNRQNVLEEINLNNYRIRLRGIIMDDNNPDEYPEEIMLRIAEICTQSGSVSIKCPPLTTIWGISQIAIEDFDFHEVRGNPGVQGYDIIGYSDEYVNLEVIENNNQSAVVDESPETI